MQYPVITWSQAISNVFYRNKLYFGLSIMAFIALFLPSFFSLIEQREGSSINDYLLRLIPAVDVSVLIFILLYGTLLLLVRQLIKDPLILLTALWGYVFLCFARLLSISLIPLDPPLGIIEMWDPLSIFFYHAKSVTKDLFFSGHTSTLCLAALCQQKKQYKIAGFVAAFIMGILLLIQHVHYTFDVLAAPVFSYLIFYLSKIYCSDLNLQPVKA